MGMRQRLGIARCLLADPELMILDEPTNGLDPAGITEFRGFVRDMVGEGRTVFLSSHLLDEVEKICDMVAIVDRGRILMQGTVAEMAAGGRPTIAIGCDDPVAAERVLHAHPAVAESGRADGDIRAVLEDGSDAGDRRHQPAARRGRHRRAPARARPGLARGAVPRGHLAPGSTRMNVRMVTAELLRLRKNRALFAWMVLMTTGAVAALYLIGQAFHLNDSVHNGPAGGAENLRHGIVVISFVGSVAAAILGSTVGTSDLSSGVLRDLIVTGRSRIGLFAARVPGMLLFWVPLVAIAYAAAVAFDFAFAGNLPTPGATAIAKDGLWVLMVTAIAAVHRWGSPR